MDARVRYTQKMIRQEFINLLAQKTLEQITVTAICENAQINRATFYKYYDNPKDLLKKLEQQQLEQLQTLIRERNACFFLDTLRIVMETMLREKLFFQILFSANGDEEFRQCIYDICYEKNMPLIRKNFPDVSPLQQELIYSFVADGCNGLLRRWMDSDMKDPIESVLDFIRLMINSLGFDFE